jgi:putative ABC transport system permease protein
MRSIQLAYYNLKSAWLTTLLSIMLLSIGLAMVSFVVQVSEQLNDRFNRDIRGIDMVVGAKGSPLQLILSAVYQIDNPTGNISVKEAERVRKNPLVKYSIPLSYGDSYGGFRIVGTEPIYLEHFKAAFSQGAVWAKSMEVVLGSNAASKLQLKLGDHFHGTHGLESYGEEHEAASYTVVGILDPTNTVADRLILTSTASVWEIHDHHDEKESEPHAEGDGEITALLVKFKSPMGIMQIPRFINEKTKMQAALPAIEINRLYELMGIGFGMLRAIGLLILAIAAISVFISLLNSLKDRKYELALMRSLGASPAKLFGLVIQEGLLLCLSGYIFGIILARVGLNILSVFGDEQFHFSMTQSGFSPVELWLLPLTIGIGILAAIIPAISAYRSDISSILKHE